MKSLVRTIALKGLTSCAIMCLALGAAQAQGDGRAAARAVEANDACTVNTAKAKAATGLVSTASEDFVNVPGTIITFRQGGPNPDCVIISFSAEAGAAAYEVMAVQAVVDGEFCPLSGNFFASSGSEQIGRADRAMNFLCPDIVPGKHTAKMQYHSNGGEVYLDFRTMIVWHRK